MLIFFQKGAFQSSKVLYFKTSLIFSVSPRLSFSLSLSLYIYVRMYEHTYTQTSTSFGLFMA